MGFLGATGILLGLLGIRFALPVPTRLRVSVFALAYVLHLAATFFYYQRALTAPADATGYYMDFNNEYENGFGAGTSFIIWIVQTGRLVLGGSALDYYFVFQAFGFWGVCLLMRTFQEVYAEVGSEQPKSTYLLLLFPSMHYWSSAIGKDALFFLALTAAIWAMMRPLDRKAPLVLGILLMLMVRPHLAAIAMAAGALAVFSLYILRATYGIDASSTSTVTDVMEWRQSVVGSEESGGSRVDAPLPLRALSFLFRPLFLDAEGAFGLIASLENVVLVILVLALLFRIRDVITLLRSVVFLRTAGIYAAIALGFFSFTYFNVGLGLRQKWAMFVPAILVMFIAVNALRRARNAAAPVGPPPKLVPQRLAS